jgi:hypothetical protein
LCLTTRRSSKFKSVDGKETFVEVRLFSPDPSLENDMYGVEQTIDYTESWLEFTGNLH